MGSCGDEDLWRRPEGEGCSDGEREFVGEGLGVLIMGMREGPGGGRGSTEGPGRCGEGRRGFRPKLVKLKLKPGRWVGTGGGGGSYMTCGGGGVSDGAVVPLRS